MPKYINKYILLVEGTHSVSGVCYKKHISVLKKKNKNDKLNHSAERGDGLWSSSVLYRGLTQPWTTSRISWVAWLILLVPLFQHL